MNKIISYGAFILIFLFATCGLSYSEAMDIGKLIDSFQGATDLQRNQILQDNLDKEITAGGIVDNAGEYDFFDTVNDVKGTYYQVSTEQQKTKNNTPYEVVFLFRDKDKAKDINKGQSIQKDGKIIKINDERLQIAVWIFCGDLIEADKALFKQN